MRRLLYLFPLLALAACGSAPSLAEQHLQLLQDGQAADAKAQYCNLNDPLKVIEVASYELLEATETEQGTEYRFALESPEVPPSGELVVLIKESEAHWQDIVKADAQLQNAGANIEPAQREDVNAEEFCVFLPFDQFDEG